MLVKLLLAAIVVAPVVLLVVSALRGRTQVRCCSLPADQDARMRDVVLSPAERPAPSAPSPSSARST